MSLQQSTVLVVDDEPDLCEMLRFEFQMNGCHVHRAFCGGDAYEVFNTNEIDAVVTDIRMPGGNGIELLERIRARTDRRQPIIVFITAYDTALSTREAFDKGAEGFFAKPFRLHDLVQRVQHMLIPPDIRWSNPPQKPPEIDFTRRYRDIDFAKCAKSCDIGRGGFAISDRDINVAIGSGVSFDVIFDEGPIKRLNGAGIIVWTVVSDSDTTARAGIEFTYLQQESRDSLSAWLPHQAAHPYIPGL